MRYNLNLRKEVFLHVYYTEKSAIAWEDVKIDEFPTKVNEK